MTAIPPPPTTVIETVPPTTTEETVDTGDVVGFAIDTIELDGTPLLVAIADTPDLRRRGLMGVSDFGDIEGMLFAYDLDTNGSFWMRDTLVPLDIAFFDAAGALVNVLTMVPCPAGAADSECPRYRPGAPYRYALERPAGTMLDLSREAVLVP